MPIPDNDIFNIVSAHTVAEIIDDGVLGTFFIENNASYGRDLETSLLQLGYDRYTSASRCTVASFESHLQKDGTFIEIVSADLNGTFIRIKIWEDSDVSRMPVWGTTFA
jgi:hypothetical protein